MPKVDSYRFGEIVIDGKKYVNDVIILPDGVYNNWWRKSGHHLCIDDLDEALKAKPKILIIGTGAYGMMNVPPEVEEFLAHEGIEIRTERTGEAVELYNRLYAQTRVVAALHLTC